MNKFLQLAKYEEPICAHPNREYILARKYFVYHDFGKALDILLNDSNKTFHTDEDALNHNIALLAQILGDKHTSERYYAKCSDDIVKNINILSFFHRFYSYRDYNNQVDDSMFSNEAFRNNYLNYQLTSRGWDGICASKSYSLYTEQLMNDYFIKVHGREHTECRDAMKRELRRLIDTFTNQVVPVSGNRIGIYLVDIQRHKNESYIFDMINILINLGKEIYIYIDNLFINKLYKMLPQDVKTCRVIKKGILEINNQIAEDKVCMLIDMTGNHLRNSTLSLSLLNIPVMNFTRILLENPFLITSPLYFKDTVISTEKKQEIYIIGDMKYISSSELAVIRDNYVGKTKLVFTCSSFDEPIFVETFQNRLNKLGYKTNSYCIKSSLLPFKKYIYELSSAEMIILTTGVTMAQISEAVYCKVPLILLSQNPKYQKIREKHNMISLSFTELNKEKVILEIEKTISRNIGNTIFKYDEDFYIRYSSNGQDYDIGYSCNGDIVVYTPLYE